MSDLMLINYYNDVRGDSWPNITNYTDFFKLSEEIKLECKQQHSFDKRISEIENPEYWQSITAFGYQFENLLYVPTAKCASTYYISIFTRLGWKPVHLCDAAPGTIFFGLMMDPYKRHVKGLTEYAYHIMKELKKIDENFNEDDLANNLILKLMINCSVIPDIHTLPYSAQFGPYLNSINWIPMDLYTDTETKNFLMQLFKANGHNINLPLNDEKIHESNSFKLKLHEQVKRFHEQNESAFLLNIFLTKDLKFYRNLLDNFELDWQTKFKTS